MFEMLADVASRPNLTVCCGIFLLNSDWIPFRVQKITEFAGRLVAAFDGTYLQQVLAPAPASITKSFSLMGGSWNPAHKSLDNSLFQVRGPDDQPRDSRSVLKATDMSLGLFLRIRRLCDVVSPASRS